MSLAWLWLALAPSMPVDARSPSADLAIEWAATAGCPGPDALRAELDRLGASASGVVRVRLAARVGETTHWMLDLSIDGGDGRIDRTAEATSCVALVEAAAIMTAVALDPLGVVTTFAIDLPEVAEPEPPAMVPARVRSAPLQRRVVSSRPSPRRVVPWLVARALVGAGLLPQIDAGAELMIALAIARVRVELGTWFLAPRPARLDDRPDAGADVGLIATTTRGCLVIGPTRVHVEACAGIGLGAAFAHAVGVRDRRTGRGLWVGVEAGPRLVLRPHRRVGIRIGVDGLVSARAPAFEITDRPTPIHRIGIAGIRGTLGVELGWP